MIFDRKDPAAWIALAIVVILGVIDLVLIWMPR